ncbi:MAG: c-type cytochrome domain-containing protein [Gemmatimonadota bacterium]
MLSQGKKLLSAMVLPVGVALVVQGSIPATDSAAHDVATPIQVSYENDVLPILEESCLSCHGAPNEDGEIVIELGYDMTTYEGLMAGSDYGPVIEPGDPDGSLFLDMIVNGDMPEDGDPLPPEQIEVIRTWIAEGAQNN